MSQPAARVLFVEDDPTVRDTVTTALRSAGYEVRTEVDGLQVEAAARSFDPDLALLDVRLPQGPNGYSIARMLRTHQPDLPIVFLTAADQVEDRLAGFEAGADDYVAKPFSVAELQARLTALLRRSGRVAAASWKIGDLLVNEDARTVIFAGEPLDLTRTEFDLLVTLGSNAGRVLSKTQLLTSVWGFDDYDQNLVEVHVSSLRRKLESGDRPRLLHTVRGVGYVVRL